jgi:hypothetical protein
MTAWEEELIAREMLENPDLLAHKMKERRWADVAALLRYVKHDVPPALAMTDPALYKTLREGVTQFYLRGGGALNLAKIEALIAENSDESDPSKGELARN